MRQEQPAHPGNMSDIHQSSGYMPYWYASGRFQSYGQMTSSQRINEPESRYPVPSGSYRSSQFVPQTVEQVILNGYFSVPAIQSDVPQLVDKHHVSWLGLDDVIGQIQHRRELYQENMNMIDQSICEAHNGLHRQVASQGRPADNRQQYSVQMQVLNLYEQQRAERVNLWRDEIRLRQSLPEQVQQYLSAYRKRSILNKPGDML